MSLSSRKLFAELASEYNIRDSGGVQILSSGLRSLDLAALAESQISRDGLTVVDRFGQRRAHPLCAVARDNRAAWQAALRSLNLAIGDPPTIGRPEGS